MKVRLDPVLVYRATQEKTVSFAGESSDGCSRLFA